MERLLQLNNPRVVSQSQDVSFRSDVTHLVFIDHLLFLHLLHGNDFVGLSVPTDTHLAESSATDDLNGDEILDGQLLPLKSVVLRLLVQDFLFDQFFLLLREVHIIHLFGQLVPSFFSFSFFVLGLRIFILYVGLGTRGLFSGGRAGRGLGRSRGSVSHA